MGSISYEKHLWQEKELKTVANVTARDLQEFLRVAAAIPIRSQVEAYPLEDANRALQELSAGHIRGAKVLKIN
jgi:propanol-preferring alcohol dehydrogenase